MRRIVAISVFVSMVTAVLVASPSLADSGGRGGGGLDAYSAVVTPEQLGELARQGHDVAEQKAGANGTTVDLVLSPSQRDDLVKKGINPQLKKVNGKTLKQLAAEQAVSGYTVWRSYDEPGGIRDQMYAIAANNPSIAKLVKLGTTIQGREILAVKLTQGARGQKDGSRPAVLYSATQHAREWIAAEVDRRLMNWYVDKWRANDTDVKKLLQSTELWFMPVANPDGYQYTFSTERLWRKNLRDNDGNGQITVGDGVDPNRNFPNHWGYDNEGSSGIPSSDTYRGKAPASEAETLAMKGLLDRIKFKFQVNYHSNGQWLLYAEGWQIATPTADDPIYYAMSGNLDNPAIDEFHPGLSSDVLYVTNGETTDYAHASTGALAWTPELSAGCDGCGFVFPDDPALVQAEFERNLPFAKSVAESATSPDSPKSEVGLTTKPFYVKSDDPYKAGIPGANFTFTVSYGDPQPVAVIAKRSLGAVTAKWKVNGGPVQSAPTQEWTGERYTPAGVYYHQVRGVVTGTKPGDTVEVWFEGGGQRSESFTYPMALDTGRKVLVVAAEDYTGASPVQQPILKYADYYLKALKANGIDADVYDVDARGRIAPDQLGVLGHYEAVVWYPGDDIVTRKAGAPGATPTGWPWTRCSSSGPTSTRAAGCSTPATRRAVSIRLWAPSCTTRRARSPAPRHRRGPTRDGAWRSPDPVTTSTTCCSTGSARTSASRRRPRRERRRRSACSGSTTRSRGSTWGLNGDAERQQPERHHVLRRHQRDPAARRVQAVRELAVGAVGQARWTVRAAYRRPVRLLADRRRDVQAADAHHHGAGRWRHDVVLDVLRHRGGLGLRLRRGPHRRPGRLDDAAGRQRPHDHRHRATAAPAGWNDLHPWLDHYQTFDRQPPAPARARAARGTRPAATRAAGSSGRSTSARMRASRSRSRSPTPATGVPRASASSSTTSSSRPARAAPRSRRAWTAGRSPGRRRAARPTPTTGSAPTPRASRSERRSRHRARSSWASGWRALRRTLLGTP